MAWRGRVGRGGKNPPKEAKPIARRPVIDTKEKKGGATSKAGRQKPGATKVARKEKGRERMIRKKLEDESHGHREHFRA